MKSYVEDNVVFQKRARIGEFPFTDLDGNQLPLNKVLLSSSFNITEIEVYNIIFSLNSIRLLVSYLTRLIHKHHLTIY